MTELFFHFYGIKEKELLGLSKQMPSCIFKKATTPAFQILP